MKALELPLKKILLIFLAWRLALFFIAAATTILLPFRNTYEFAGATFFSPDAWMKNPLLEPWANFDGVHYLIVAQKGYDNEARFFPVYPLSIRFVGSLLGISEATLHTDAIFAVIGLVLANLAFVAALMMLYRLLHLDFSERTAFWSCLFLIFFPTSFFFVSIYAESIFLLLACSAFYAARKGWWWLAALCAALLGATRAVGILLLPALVVEYALTQHLQWPRRFPDLFVQLRNIKLNVLWLLIAPLGLISFMIFNQSKFGKWSTFIEQQAALGNSRIVSGVVDPVRVTGRYLKILTTISIQQYEWWIALIELMIFVLGVGLLFALWRRKVRPSYLVYALSCFLMPVISGTLSGLPRYIVVIFPFFMIFALIKSARMRYLLVLLFSILSTVLLVLFSRGYFVG